MDQFRTCINKLRHAGGLDDACLETAWTCEARKWESCSLIYKAKRSTFENLNYHLCPRAYKHWRHNDYVYGYLSGSILFYIDLIPVIIPCSIHLLIHAEGICRNPRYPLRENHHEV